MLAGALWREERMRELLGWHATHVMAGSGAKRKDGGTLDLWAILGRGPVPGFYWQTAEPIIERPTAPEEPVPTPEPAPAMDPIRLRMEQLVKQGMAVRVQ